MDTQTNHNTHTHTHTHTQRDQIPQTEGCGTYLGTISTLGSKP